MTTETTIATDEAEAAAEAEAPAPPAPVRWHARTYLGGPLDGRTALFGFFTAEEIEELPDWLPGPYVLDGRRYRYAG